MRILKLVPIVLTLAASPVFSSDDHDHKQAEPNKDHHDSNLLEQLGFEIVTVRDHLIAGKEVISLPVEAVFQEKGKTFVVAQSEDDPENLARWEVQLGQNDGQMVEAKRGVFPGDKIVVKRSELSLYNSTAPVAATSKAVVTAKPKVKTGNYGVQIGAFSKAENAKKVADQLKANYGSTEVLVSEAKGKSIYLVRVGEYTSFRSAKDTKEKLVASGFPQAFVVGD